MWKEGEGDESKEEMAPGLYSQLVSRKSKEILLAKKKKKYRIKQKKKQKQKQKQK
jgi:hypothetical protein